MIPHHPSLVEVAPLSRRLGAGMQSIAFVILLGCMAGRCFVTELPFRISAVPAGIAQQDPSSDAMLPAITDRSELSRVTFAMLLLGALGLWLIGCAFTGELPVRCGPVALLIALFAACSLLSALRASDWRSAWDVWIEQVALLGACWAAAQMCADRRRFRLLVIVLGALGGVLAVKGLWQVTVEVPQRIGDFEMYRAERLAQLGWVDGTPQAKLIESRMRDWSPFGFFSLTNLFASLMVLLSGGAIALGVDKLLPAIRCMRNRSTPRTKGEIDLPLIAAILTCGIGLFVIVILTLTRSRGAIGALAVVTVLGVLVGIFGRSLGRHWKKCVLAGCAVFLLGACGVIGFGLVRDRLPTKTMTFRWYYWTASGQIVRDRPILGVGPGNFPSAYLRYRRPAAEEEIKAPHNLVVHAAVQYGLLGAALYVCILGYVLVAGTRPGRSSDSEHSDNTQCHQSNSKAGRRRLLLLLIVAVFAFTARVVFAPPVNTAMLVLECIAPAAVFFVCLLIASWYGGAEGSPGTSTMRLILVGGLFAFVLHNMVTFSLWAPGAALTFWIIAGACIGQAGGKSWRIVRARWFIAAIFIAGVIAAGQIFWSPVFFRTRYTERMLKSLQEGDILSAVTYAVDASELDPSDARAKADTAKVASMARRANVPKNLMLKSPYEWAVASTLADTANSSYHRLAARLAFEDAQLGGSEGATFDDGVRHMARAVELNPNDARLRVSYARVLLAADRFGECLGQLTAAERLEAQLFPESVEKFNTSELRQIQAIKRQCQSHLDD